MRAAHRNDTGIWEYRLTPTYLFYDIESSGLNKCFDQVLQFAAIRTDLAFNELARYEIAIAPNCDIFPAPMATITHHISPTFTTGTVNEYEGIVQIHHLLNQPGTISLGYNTLTFDDEFLRFSFYRHLLTPYTHQFANQCQRMDLYPMLLFFHLYKPDVLPQWPVIDGQVSLKLDNISQANHLATGRAHTALVDVEATVALAKLLHKETAMWQYLQGFYQKTTDQNRSQQLPITMESTTLQHHEGLMIMGKLGTRNSYQAPVLSIGPHNHYKNQTLWLRLDLPELRETTLDNLDEKTWVLSKKWAEPGFLLPPDRYARTLKPERIAEIKANKQWIMDHPQLFQEVIQYHREFKYPTYPNTDVDALLYQRGFMTPQEVSLCQRFHQAAPAQKGLWIERFQDLDLQTLAIRLMGRHYPEHLPEAYRPTFARYLQQVLSPDPSRLPIDFKNTPRLGYTQAQAQWQEARARPNLSAEQVELLETLAKHYETLCHPAA